MESLPQSSRRIVYSSYEELGGAAVHVQNFVRAARQIGTEITCIGRAPRDGEMWPKRRRVRACVHHWLRDLALLGAELYRLTRAIGPTWRSHPDAIIARARYLGYHEWLLAKCLGLPLVLEVNAPCARERQRFEGRSGLGLAAPLERCMWRAASRICCVSGPLAQEVMAAGVSADRIAVVPNGASVPQALGLAERREARAEIGARDEDTVVAVVSGFRPWHGAAVAAEAAVLLAAERNVLFVFIGDGPQRGPCEAIVRTSSADPRARFLGQLRHSEVQRHLLAADVGVVTYSNTAPSYFSPLKVFEYMAVGMAIVAPDHGQVYEVLEDRVTALLMRENSPTALARAIMTLVRDRPLRQRLGATARVVALERYTWEANAKAIMAQVDSVSVRSRATIDAGPA